jgi:hypothetical protein
MHAAPASLCTLVLGLALGVGIWPASAQAQAQALGDAPRVPRHWSDISLSLPEASVTALAVDPGDGEVVFAGVDGFVFKSDDQGESWRPVLSFARGLPLASEQRLNTGQGRREQGELDMDGDPDVDSMGERSVTPGLDPNFDPAFNPDLDFSLDPSFDPSIDPTLDPDLLGIPTGAIQGEFDEFGDFEDTGDFEALGDLADLNDAFDAADFQAFDASPMGEGDLPAGDGDLRDRFPRQGRGTRAIRFVGPGSTTLYVATPRGLYRSTDTGESFVQLSLPGGQLASDVRDVAIDPVRPDRIYVATAAGSFLSLDAGAQFEQLPGRAGTDPGLAVLARRVGKKDLVLLGTERGLLRSWSGPEAFLELLLKGRGPFEPVGVLALDDRSGITYAGTLRGLFVGERDAAILEGRQSISLDPIWSLSVDPTRARGIAIGLPDHGVVQSDDTGITLLELPDALPATTAYALARSRFEPDALLAGTERGAFQLVKGTGVRVGQEQLRRLMRAWQKEPSLQETTGAALAYAQIDFQRTLDMMSRARWAALLPGLQATFDIRNQTPDRQILVVSADNADLFDESNIDEILFLSGDGLFDQAPSQGIIWQVFVVLTWNLDRTIFNASEVAAARQLPILLNRERQVMTRVRTLYGARRRLMTQIQFNKDTGEARQEAARLLRLAELTSLLSATTGGAFVQMAQERGASLPELELEYGLFRDPEPTAALFNPRGRWDHRQRSDP